MLNKAFLLIFVLVVVADFAKSASECERKLEEARSNQKKGMVGMFIPKCDEDGSFKKKQFHGSTGYFFCVDPETGDRIGDSKRDPGMNCD